MTYSISPCLIWIQYNTSPITETSISYHFQLINLKHTKFKRTTESNWRSTNWKENTFFLNNPSLKWKEHVQISRFRASLAKKNWNRKIVIHPAFFLQISDLPMAITVRLPPSFSLSSPPKYLLGCVGPWPLSRARALPKRDRVEWSIPWPAITLLKNGLS